MRLSALYRYPVKSLRGHCLLQAHSTAKGLQTDRRYMLVDEERRFITQRQHARLALLDVQVDADILRISDSHSGTTIAIEQPAHQQDRITVNVWRDTCVAQTLSRQIDRWFSDYLGLACRLVYLPDDSVRPVDRDYACRPQDEVSFADGYPFLLISQASLDLLNDKLRQQDAAALPMLRFRPNLVIEGCQAHAEDDWATIQIGEMIFDVVKPCSRCVIPTIDIDSAQRGVEPTRTLMTYRRKNNKIYFGQNLIHHWPGEPQTLNVGDKVTVLEYK